MTRIIYFLFLLFFGMNYALLPVSAEDAISLKSIPRMQAIPQPYDQISYQCEGRELTRYHFGASLKRPFVFPVLGPSGISLTRMGHPHDPDSHKHHYSFWVAHSNVNGVDFWSETGAGSIAHRRTAALEDGDDCCYSVSQNDWIDAQMQVLLHETRRISVYPLENKEWMLILDLEFTPDKMDITFGADGFGLASVRVAKTLGVNDGGGVIRNAEGGVNEEAIFRKKTKWVDYSGRIVHETVEGITLFDHPKNLNYPAPFHVRNDGWMGAFLSFDNPITLKQGETLNLRYGLYVHAGMPSLDAIGQKWENFTKIP